MRENGVNNINYMQPLIHTTNTLSHNVFTSFVLPWHPPWCHATTLYKLPPNRYTGKKLTGICYNLVPGTDVLSLSKAYFYISMCLSPIHPILPHVFCLFTFMTRCKLSRPETLAAHKCVTLSHSVFNMFISTQIMSVAFPVPSHGVHHENSHGKTFLSLSKDSV